MRVLFLQDVPNVAKAGDTKDVADGYARNYLLPRKLATPFKAGAANQLALIDKAKAREEDELQKLAQRLEGFEITLKARAGAKERLYGSVTSADVAKELDIKGFSVDKRKIEIAESFHQLGSYEVLLRLGPGSTPKIKVHIVAEEVTKEGAGVEKKPEKTEARPEEHVPAVALEKPASEVKPQKAAPESEPEKPKKTTRAKKSAEAPAAEPAAETKTDEPKPRKTRKSTEKPAE